jgi:hypothetical protein
MEERKFHLLILVRVYVYNTMYKLLCGVMPMLINYLFLLYLIELDKD